VVAAVLGAVTMGATSFPTRFQPIQSSPRSPRPTTRVAVSPRGTVGRTPAASGKSGSRRGSLPGFDSGGRPISGRQAFPTESGKELYLPARYATGPRFLQRTDWDPSPPRGAWSPRSSIESVTLHHSAGPVEQTVEVIRDYHKSSGNFGGDIAYHFLIKSNGDIYEGVPMNYTGAHSNPNSRRLGICLVGHFTDEDIMAASYAPMRESLLYLLEALDAAFPGITSRMRPHGPEKVRSYTEKGKTGSRYDKDCPGATVETWFDGRWEAGWSRAEVPGADPVRAFAYGVGVAGDSLGLHEDREHVPPGWAPPLRLP